MHKAPECNEEYDLSGVSKHGELRSRSPLSWFAAHCRAETLAVMESPCWNLALGQQRRPAA